MKRTCEIKVRFTKNELQELDKKVKKTGLSREGYVRLILQNKIPVALPPADYFDLAREVRALGNNINQIAQRAHSLGFIDAPKYRTDAEKIFALADKMTTVCLPQNGND